MNRKGRVVPAVLLAMLLVGLYPWVINSCTFYPDRTYVPEALPPGIEEIFIATDDGERIQCYWLPHPSSPWVLIYFNGNSGNIAHRIPDLIRLSDLNLNVLGAGYRGFGRSSGRPSENGIYRDGRAVLNHVLKQRGFKAEQVILMGFSLGTTVVVDIAREQPLGGLILLTPLTSGRAVAREHGYGPFALFAGNAFNSLSKMDRIRTPLLILHGTADEVVPIAMGEQIYAAARGRKQMVVIDGAHHNNIAVFAPELYFESIRNFIADLSSSTAADGDK